MQIVSNGDNLHEISNHVSWEKYGKNKKNITNLLSAELAQGEVKVKLKRTIKNVILHGSHKSGIIDPDKVIFELIIFVVEEKRT